ncbi:sulfurtransferase [Streptomyces candidus]|nr:sulfurtransferase [Streptomyces candidus]
MDGTGAGLPGPLVGVEWLAERLGAPGLVVLDASVGRHRLKGPWIPEARVFDIDGEMSQQGEAHPPHTMLAAGQFAARVRALGMDSGDRVVVYDAAGIYSSARAWWMLRAMGFEEVAVLNGGLPAWRAAGLPVKDSYRQGPFPDGNFAAQRTPGAFVGGDEVREALDDPETVVLDARSRGRFDGTEPEPRAGVRGGHMPGSVNLPFAHLQDAAGRMRSASELRDMFAQVAGGTERLVVSCGSGVTACVLALGARLAGYGGAVAVYDGSWSEWGAEGSGRGVAGAGAADLRD